MADSVDAAPGAFARANGIDIHYRTAGSGPPLILLHGGSVSNDPVWNSLLWGWAPYIDELASSFTVLAPDLRGHGWTRNPAGSVSYDLLAEDLAALIETLGLDRPAVIGFSDGGIVASVLTIKDSDALSAHVNIAGYDLFDPASPTMAMMRKNLAAEDPSAVEPGYAQLEAQGGPWFDALLASHDAAQGPGTWRTVLGDAFDRWTAPIGHDLDELRQISTPTLIMAGDRDACCSPEESVRAFRLIPGAELAIVPRRPHVIAPEMIAIATAFLSRRIGS